MTIRIFLIDEHRPAREIIARRLASIPGLDVAGSTCDGDAAIREIEGLSPDVVLIDTKMKHSDGMDICRRAVAADNQATVEVLTSYLDPDELRLAYQAGVDGCLLKDVDTDNLANWIKVAVGRDPGDSDDTEDQAGGYRGYLGEGPPFSALIKSTRQGDQPKRPLIIAGRIVKLGKATRPLGILGPGQPSGPPRPREIAGADILQRLGGVHEQGGGDHQTGETERR